MWLKKGAFSVLILSLAKVAFSQVEDYSQWGNFKNITVNTSGSGGGAGISANEIKFPVLIRLTSANADVFTGSKGRGADLRFSKANGIHLPYQIERWDSAAQAAEIWVGVDTVFGANAFQSLRMFWNKTGSVDSSNAAAVYPAANGFIGDWHLGNASGTTARPNSVSGAPAATPTNFPTSYTPKSGIIAFADSMRGGAGSGSNDYLNIGGSYAGYSDFTNGVTLSLWAYPTVAADYGRFFDLGSGQSTSNILFMRISTGTDLSYEHWNSGTSGGYTTATGVLELNTWQHLAVTVKPAGAGSYNVTIFKNGANVMTGTAGVDMQNVVRTNNWIGRSAWGNDAYYRGKVDEPIVANVPRDSDWVKLSYETQKTGSTCVTLGATSVISAPTALAYSTNPATYGVGVAITPNAPTYTGGPVGSFSVGTALPAGLSLNTATGVITGTPTAVSATASYIVTAANNLGSTTASVSITVNVVPPTGITYSTPTAIYGMGLAITPNTPTYTGGRPTSYTVAPALPAGLSLNATTGVITGTPTATSAATNYVVTAGNTAGSVTTTLNFAVSAPPTGFSYPASVYTFTRDVSITALVPTVTGTVTGYSVNPALPLGLNLNDINGIISGTPYITSAATTYVVTATNTAGSASFTLTITVNAPSGILSRQVSGNFLMRVGAVSLSFPLPEQGVFSGRLEIVDLGGQTVWIKDLELDKGTRELTWNGRTAMGAKAATGVYAVRMTFLDAKQKILGVLEKKMSFTPQ